MNILLTAIGSMSALCAINKLHEAGHKVIGCDIYPEEWHYEASLCDVFKQAPYANTEEYIPFLIQLAKENEVKYIFRLILSMVKEKFLRKKELLFAYRRKKLSQSPETNMFSLRHLRMMTRFYLFLP